MSESKHVRDMQPLVDLIDSIPGCRTVSSSSGGHELSTYVGLICSNTAALRRLSSILSDDLGVGIQLQVNWAADTCNNFDDCSGNELPIELVMYAFDDSERCLTSKELKQCEKLLEENLAQIRPTWKGESARKQFLRKG